MGRWATPLLLVCWVAWAAVWLAGGLYNLARGPRTRRRSPEWPFWLLAGVVWGFARGARGLPAATMLRSPWAFYVGAALLVAGTAFTVWARLVLGRMWSAAPSVKESHELQTGGPYAVVRHPIYTGMLGMGLGTALVGDRWWEGLLFVLFVVYVLVKSGAEERLMRETFGERYADYQRRTPRLFPRPGRVWVR